jgi:hypothetical protein
MVAVHAARQFQEQAVPGPQDAISPGLVLVQEQVTGADQGRPPWYSLPLASIDR